MKPKIVSHRNLSILSEESIADYAREFLKRTYDQYGPDIYSFPFGTYLGASKKIKLSCRIHGEYLPQIPGNFFKYGCPNSNKQVKFLARATKKFKERFDYLNLRFIDYREKVEIGCKDHGIQSITPELHLKYGCMECVKLEKFKKRQRVNTTKKYDYSKIGTITDKELEILCPIHGSFFQTARAHLNTNCKGCPKCFYEKISNDRKTDPKKFLAEVNEIHCYKYNYNLKGKIALRDVISIICSEHGSFQQTAANHLAGRGCPECGIIKMSNTKRYSHEKWLEQAIAAHRPSLITAKANMKEEINWCGLDVLNITTDLSKTLKII